MRALSSIVALSGLILAGGLALAQTAPTPPKPPKPLMAGMSHGDHARMMADHSMMDHGKIVAARQAGFHLTI
ncbi:MAG: hypothetical protein K2W86_15550, partial [Sphingomonas sp.]|uniref:hypothetical protein n=1 Tax=Sphingomonas sp. TaxID=28214 RepID=UPI0035A84122|nr:hypothetical protein [Sphingomonas sp.]